jgi:hypothetical protein
VKKIEDRYVGFDKEPEFTEKSSSLKKEPVEEAVDHPPHYNHGIEVIDFIDSWDFNFTVGNIIKYVSRHEYKKEPLEDLKKAKWYLDRLIRKYEN